MDLTIQTMTKDEGDGEV